MSAKSTWVFNKKYPVQVQSFHVIVRVGFLFCLMLAASDSLCSKFLETNESQPEKQCAQGDMILQTNGSFMIYHNSFFQKEEADQLADTLFKTLDWDWTFYESNGTKIRGPRQMAWYADDSNWNYKFSRNHVPGLLVNKWTPELLHIRHRVQDHLGVTFNCVLANLYVKGEEHSAWHSDDDPWLGFPEPLTIPSISFGNTRTFSYRAKADKEAVTSLDLRHGSLVVMGGNFQNDFQHSIPKTAKQDTYRINLTFRNIINPTLEPRKEYWHS